MAALAGGHVEAAPGRELRKCWAVPACSCTRSSHGPLASSCFAMPRWAAGSFAGLTSSSRVSSPYAGMMVCMSTRCRMTTAMHPVQELGATVMCFASLLNAYASDNNLLMPYICLHAQRVPLRLRA
jgi:hypothetical protein